MNLAIIEHPSPNYDARSSERVVDTLVMHYTGMPSAKEALDHMCDANSQVSAHYMIDEDGTVYRLVNEAARAWHAGISCWKGWSALNHNSLGIELVNPGHEWGYRAFPEAQMQSLIALSQDILSRHDISPENVVGHSDIAPNRKEDPGEFFDWPLLASHGIGYWPAIEKVKMPSQVVVAPFEEGTEVAFMQQRLASYGYHIRVDGYYGPKAESVVKAFKRHFVPSQVNAQWDRLADAMLDGLLKLVEK